MSTSIELDTLDQQDSSSASVGTTNASLSASVGTTNASLFYTPEASPRSSLQQLRRPSQPQQAPPQDKHTVWSKIVEERGFILGVVVLSFTIVVVPWVWEEYLSGLWSNAEVFYGWCKDEQIANHTLTRECRKLVDRPLPPPPGLDKVFPDISRRDDPPLSNRPPTDEEREMFLTFLRGPVGNGLSLAIIGFFALMLPVEDGRYKWLYFSYALFVFHITRDVSPLFTLRNVSLLFTFRNVSLMMDWVYWLRRVGAKGPSLRSLAALPVFYAVGYLNEKSTTTEWVVVIASVLIAGDYYSLKLQFVWIALNGLGEKDRLVDT